MTIEITGCLRIDRIIASALVEPLWRVNFMWKLFLNRFRRELSFRRYAGTRRFRRKLEILEDRSTPAAIPTVSLVNVPSDPLIGENFSFTARFDNSSVTDAGFGPYIDLFVKTTGADGSTSAPNDGLSFVSATYLGAPLQTVPVTLTAAGVPHPFAIDSAGNPLIITPPPGFVAGDTLVVILPPFGSFAATQPRADIVLTMATSTLADLNAPLPIVAQGGFIYGNDAISNPTTDPTIVGQVTSSTVSPTVLRLTKTYVGPENETATGPNYPRQYRITVDVANGQTLTNLDVTDLLANNVQFVSVDSSTANGSPAVTLPISTPSTIVVGGTLTRRFLSVTGTSGTNDAQVTFSYYVPLNDAAGNPVIDPNSGDDATSVDDASAEGTWQPVDPRDPPVTAVSNATANDHTLTDKSIAVQKTVANVNDVNSAGNSPGDTLEYTVNFQISDYFAFQNLVLNDLFSDGQVLVPSSISLSATDGHAGTTSGVMNASNFTLTPNAVGGSDRLVARISDELALRGFSPNG